MVGHQLLVLLETDPRLGLTSGEAKARSVGYGPNMLPQTRPEGWFRRLLRQVHNPLIYVLLVAGGVTTVLGEYVDAIVIFGVVVINAGVGFVQESKAEAALDALRALVQTTATVVRSGVVCEVDSRDLVPGDLVKLEAGDKVPADIRLLTVDELQVDESALTGESVPVAKDEVVLPVGTAVADRRNMVHSGTFVTSGSASGVVVEIGSATELGQIHRLMGSVDELTTPLTRRLAGFSKVLTVVILAAAAATFAIGVWRGEPWSEMFKAAVALAVGAIPEGLPAAVTITLAIGVGRMAQRRAVIRRMPAVETLGSTTVICTDKTGTLTENRMTVRVVQTPQARYRCDQPGIPGAGLLRDEAGDGIEVDVDAALLWSLRAGALCTDASVQTDDRGAVHTLGDPTEVAMVLVADQSGIDVVALSHDWARLETIPFTSARMYMATMHSCPQPDESPSTAQRCLLAKGAVERILALCDSQMNARGQTEPLDREGVLAQAQGLAGTGLRVLATAAAPTVGQLDPAATTPPRLVFTGLQAMLDPPRPAAATAVATCQGAGIEVKMITGDHAATAAAIGREVGILTREDPPAVVTGAQLARLTDAELAKTVPQAQVFARVDPEQKLALVEALRARGQVVAMTGDGVNDAPALRQADIGIAMGFGGTEVAKEASDMVLLDDDFATIEAAVEEGRGVFDNLIKFIVWTLPTNMGEGLVILLAILLGAALPILPVQILWINMTTAVFLGLMLAFEPKEPGIMSRPPRRPGQPLLPRFLVVRMVLVAMLLVAASWWLYRWEVSSGADVESARTAAVNLFVVVEAFYLFSCRSLTGSALRVGAFSNRWILGGVAIQTLGQLALTYLPAMNAVFGTAPIGADVWLRIFAAGAAVWLLVAVDKRIRRPVGAAT